MPLRNRCWLSLIALLAASFPAGILAQEKGVVQGALVDKVSGTPVLGAPVWLDGKEPVEVTDEEGRFRFVGVKPGRHEIVIKDPEHTPFQASFEVTAGKTTKLRYALDPLGEEEVQEVVIRSERLEAQVSDTVLEVEEEML